MIHRVFILLISFIAFFSQNGFAQEDNRVLDFNSDQEEVRDAFGVRLIGSKGKFFLDNKWRNADVYFRSGLVVKDYPVRYDIQFNLLEVRIGEDIRVLPIGKMIKYEFLDPTTGRIVVHGSGRDFRTEHGTPMSGLCEIYERGVWAMLTKINYSIKDPDYIKEFDVGNKEEKLFIDTDRYLCINKVAYPLTYKKKELINIISQQSGPKA